MKMNAKTRALYKAKQECEEGVGIATDMYMMGVSRGVREGLLKRYEEMLSDAQQRFEECERRYTESLENIRITIFGN